LGEGGPRKRESPKAQKPDGRPEAKKRKKEKKKKRKKSKKNKKNKK
jgi:hypothetical protein